MKLAGRYRGAVLLGLAIAAGAALRLSCPLEIEYKLDERYMFERVAGFGTEPWQWLGMPSGVRLRNPGLSVWVFIALGRIFGASDPAELSRSVAILSVLALVLAAIFAFRFVGTGPRGAEAREPWLWAVALAAVNPLAVMYQRKIWAQSVLPSFCVLFLMAWWRRERRWGAFAWGLLGTCLGQIHMSGFFYAAAFAAWTLMFARRGPRWRFWVAGSALGALPLIPWFHHVLTAPSESRPRIFGLDEALQLKYWVFWISDGLGLHLGNVLGVHRGASALAQLGDFARYPLLADGAPTWLVGAAHAALLGVGLLVLLPPAYRAARRKLEKRAAERPLETDGQLARGAALWAYGALLTASRVSVRRYYLLITFPLTYVWLAGLALRARFGRALLVALIVLQAFVSLQFLAYVRDNGGSALGDFGDSYRKQISTK